MATNLGGKVKEIITGFEEITTGIHIYLVVFSFADFVNQISRIFVS